MASPAQSSHVCVAQVVCRQAQVLQDAAFLDNGGGHTCPPCLPVEALHPGHQTPPPSLENDGVKPAQPPKPEGVASPQVCRSEEHASTQRSGSYLAHHEVISGDPPHPGTFPAGQDLRAPGKQVYRKRSPPLFSANLHPLPAPPPPVLGVEVPLAQCPLECIPGSGSEPRAP